MEEQESEERAEEKALPNEAEQTAEENIAAAESAREPEAPTIPVAEAVEAVEQPQAAPSVPASGAAEPESPSLAEAAEEGPVNEEPGEPVPETAGPIVQAEAEEAPKTATPSVKELRDGRMMQQGEVPTETSSEAAWYVIHCYSGYENKVRHNLEQRIETMGMKDKIFDVVIPTQEEIEVRDGKRRTVERHIFPGYVLVNMQLSEESWYVVRNTPGVTGFVGMGNLPTPLRPEEVAQIVKRMEAEAPAVKVSFKLGERVRIIDGPFNDFRGTVADIDVERTKVRVMVSFFGRETPVELDFLQVERA